MLIDCFPYFNESELLELRIKLLYDHFDMFIITEGSHTHKGVPKPFTLLETLKNLGIPLDKIKIVNVELPNSVQEPDNWVRERMQRNAASEFINEGDVAFVSDCDEIIDPTVIDEYVQHLKENKNILLRVPMAYLSGTAGYRVFMDNGKPVLWPTPFLCMKHHLEKYTLSDLREDQALNKHAIHDFIETFPTVDGEVRDSGWHFTWMGGRRRMHVKYKNFLHEEFSLNQKFVPGDGNGDPLNRVQHTLKKYPLEKLPKEVFQLERVNNFLFPEYHELH